MDRIKGQDAAVAALRAAFSAGRVPHSFLFVGPSGVGKSIAAYDIAKALLCRKGPETACEKCPSCRRVESRTHSDLFPLGIRPERSTIIIDDVRALCEFASRTPLEGERKVVIIDPADAMTEEAQNAFLKTLEEPPADTTIILVAVNSDALLPTVRSRCRRVTFNRIADALIEEFLAARGIPKKDAAVLSRLADGSFGGALGLAELPDIGSRAEAVEAVLAAGPGDEEAVVALIAGEPSGRGKKAKKERRKDTTAVLSSLHSVIVDCLRVKSGSSVRTNADLAGAIERFAAGEDFETLWALEKELSGAIIILGSYADPRLAATRVAAAFTRRAAGRETEAS